MFPQNFPSSDRLAGLNEVRIKFISGTIPFANAIHVNPAYWILKSWYVRHGKHNNKINWLEAIHYNVPICEDEIARIIEAEKPNVLCVGLYIWNQALYTRLGRYVSERWPDIALIAGGPEIYAHKELNQFWDEHAWLDAVAYGDGEKAFTAIIDTMIDSSTADSAHNISYISKDDERILLPFVRFKDDEFNLISPFVDNQPEVHAAVNQIRSADPTLEIIMNWEFTKGCPYTCAFCDWSSGLHHKVTRKKYDWKVDLDFFSSLNVSVRWADANIGLFKDDIDVIKYACELENANPKFRLSFNNLAKLNKKAVFSMIDYLETVRPGSKLHAFSVQDIHADVLANIDRPDVPWPEHKNYIMEAKKKHSSMRFTMEMMIGLPGQTLESSAEAIIEFGEMNANLILGHIWCMLINSPGYNPDYRAKHQLRVVPALHISSFPNTITSRSDLLKNIDYCEYYAANTVVGSASSTLGDIMAISGMVTVYNVMHSKMGRVDQKVLSRAMRNYSYWRKFGEEISRPLEEDLQNFGQMLLVYQKDGRPVTFGSHFNDPKVVADIIRTAYRN